jgi:signal peptidase II
MKKETKQTWMVALIVVLSLVIDQFIKLYVATHFALGQSYEVTSWFWLCFVENDGMAFGIEWFSKLALTLFRLLAIVLIGWYTHALIHKYQSPTGYIATIAFVIAGAAGNIIDCIFYGKLFGYAGWFYGRVVDMFYFPLIRNSAGEVLFFRPVFNFADSCITCAVAVILLFYMKELNRTFGSKEEQTTEAQ